jgi:hypothetical protein
MSHNGNHLAKGVMGSTMVFEHRPSSTKRRSLDRTRETGVMTSKSGGRWSYTMMTLHDLAVPMERRALCPAMKGLDHVEMSVPRCA